MKIYLSGKITGDDNYKSKFAAYEEKLKKFGFEVFNPAIMPNMFDYEDFMKLDFLALSFCDAIYLLPDWEESSGAKREFAEANRLGLKIFKDVDYSFGETLLQLCDDSHRVANHTIEDGVEYDFCIQLKKMADYIKLKVCNFEFDKTDEENFMELCNSIPIADRDFFFEEFIKEGYIQLEYDIDELPENIRNHESYLRMVEASKKMSSIAFSSFYGGKRKFA